MSYLRKCDIVLMVIIIASLILTVILAQRAPDFFSGVFAAEDGPVEYATALFLLIAGGVLTRHVLSLWGKGRRVAALLTAVYALLFLMAAGEEISWGQRLVGWDSGEFFQQHNKQNETNLHNLMVGDVHLTKSLFGPVLTVVILLYLVVLPLIYTKRGRIAGLADSMAVPVPWLHHGAIALLASIVIAVVDAERKWEVYELIFSLLVVSIFILPQNRDKTR